MSLHWETVPWSRSVCLRLHRLLHRKANGSVSVYAIVDQCR
eukprot:COSAG02_NODE_48080_length_336_cov_0.877637_2_plen_40_part_01